MGREPPDFRLLTRNDGGPIATLCRVDSYARVVEPRVCDVWRGFCALGGVAFGAGQGLGSGTTALTECQLFVCNTLGKSLSRKVV
jgi:hypothetical protein